MFFDITMITLWDFQNITDICEIEASLHAKESVHLMWKDRMWVQTPLSLPVHEAPTHVKKKKLNYSTVGMKWFLDSRKWSFPEIIERLIWVKETVWCLWSKWMTDNQTCPLYSYPHPLVSMQTDPWKAQPHKFSKHIHTLIKSLFEEWKQYYYWLGILSWYF